MFVSRWHKKSDAKIVIFFDRMTKELTEFTNKTINTMKKIIHLTLIAVSIVFFLTGCKKQEVVRQNDDYRKSDKAYTYENIEEFEQGIDRLINETGIDIYEISKFESTNKIADQIRPVLTVEFEEGKGGLTIEILNEIEYYEAAINEAYNQGDENLTWSLFGSFCTLCGNIDGFIISSNENGWLSYTYDAGSDPIMIPPQFHAVPQQVGYLKEDVKKAYTTFSNLSQEIQDEVITAAIYLNLSKFQGKEKPQDCKERAYRILALDLSATTVLHTTKMISCLATGPFISICEAAAFAIYAATIARQVKLYRDRVKKCETYGWF